MSVKAIPDQHPEQNRVSTQRFSRRRFFAGSALTVAALGLYPTEIERHYLEVTHHTLRIPNLPSAFHGFRIAQISDIHLEWFTEDFFLRHAIAKINHLAPDLVLITGDYITNNPYGPDNRAYAAMPRCTQLLPQIQCPLRYGILGNHDLAVDAPAVLAAVTAGGINVLVNRHVPIERNGQRIFLGGLDDCTFGVPDLSRAIPDDPGAPVILMCHEPDYIESINRHPKGQFVDLVLSGHSHGGQVQLPFKGPLLLPPLGQKFYQGLYNFGHTNLYVNRGLGTVGLPIRFNCPPELTHITLQPA